jgi:hypothetical protein
MRPVDRFGTVFLAGAIACVVATAGCAWFGQSTPPAWIDGTSKDYPTEQYLVGVGRADQATTAAENAYAAVAKVFKAEVSAQSRDWESYLLVENRAGAKSERRLNIDQVTKVSTDKVIENVRVLDSWVDRKSGTHYALAGMNRAQAAAAAQERLAELDRAVETQVQEARQSANKLNRVRNLRRAIKTLVLRDATNADLRVIRATGQGNPAAYRVPDLTVELEQFLAGHFSVSVDVTGEQQEPVRRAVMEGLLREGLPVTTKTAGDDPARPAELAVNGTVRLWKIDVSDPQFKYVRWCSDFVLVETDSQRVVGAVSRAGREGHLTHAEATAKALRVMQQEITSQLSKTLADYVYGDSEIPATQPPAACPRADGATGPR